MFDQNGVKPRRSASVSCCAHSGSARTCWTSNAIVSAVRDVIYYSGHDLGHPLAVLSLWAGGALVILIAIDLMHMSARRSSDAPAHKIHSTPGLVMLRQRLT